MNDERKTAAPSLFSWHGATLQLLFLLILPVAALLLAVTFGSLWLHQRAMHNMVAERDERAARAAAAAISEQLNHRAASARSLALHVAASGAPERSLADFAFLLPDFEGGLAVFSVAGELLATSNGLAAWQERPVQPWLPPTPAPGEVYFSPVFPDVAASAHPGEQVMLVTAVGRDGVYAVSGAFYPGRLVHTILAGTFAGHQHTSVFVVEPTGQLLYLAGHHQDLDAPLVEHPGVLEAFRGHSGSTSITAAGEERIIAFSPILPVGWALVVEEPWHAVADPMLQMTQLAPLLIVPVLLLTLVALWFGARQIVQPLQSLAERATALGWGHYEAIEEPVAGIAEIRQLQTELVHMARKVKAAQASLHSYVGAVTAGQEEERRRLARELHDDTIQSLIALNQRIQLAQLELDNHPVAAKLEEVQQLTGQTIEDVRRFVRALRPIYLEDLGLKPALEMLARDSAEALGIPVRFAATGRDRRLGPEVELAFYRIAQEALSNVARHAEAGQASVRLDFTPDAAQLLIEDDGRGFQLPESPAAMAARGHFGLLGMYERAELIGGRLEIESAPGAGSRLRLALPSPGKTSGFSEKQELRDAHPL
jgi:signal transduction histidine kinase